MAWRWHRVRVRTLIIAFTIAAAVVVVGGVGFVGACKYTSLRCNVLIYGDPLAQESGAIVLPEGFSSEVVAAGLDVPTAFDFLPDGRILVGEKDGVVRIVEKGEVQAKPLLDLRHRVSSVLYRGLVAVAVDPDFDENGFVYVVYSARREGMSSESPTYVVVSRFVVSDSSASGERIILGRDGPAAGDCAKLPVSADCLPSDVDHIGADIAFARDGTMFVSTGDGGGHERVEDNAFDAQAVDALGGKVLRVTRDGHGLPSNPYFNGDTTANRSKVWALGLRNPFRLTLSPEDDVPVVADVGWQTADEVSIAPSAANLGWPCFEGRSRAPKYRETDICRALYARGGPIVEPVIEVRHTGVNSLTGGVFHMGDAYPPEYRGYYYGDWAQGWIRRASIDVPGSTLEREPSEFAQDAGGPVAFRVGSDGLLYYLGLNFRELRRITYSD